jgi:hypothetical protein
MRCGDAVVATARSSVAVDSSALTPAIRVDPEHQLCCAHALRELAAVAEHAGPDVDWCWATQAGDAVVAMQKLVAEAIAAGADTLDPDTLDPDALDKQTQLYRSAAQIGLSATAARSTPAMRRHHALARRLLDRQDDYLRFTRDGRALLAAAEDDDDGAVQDADGNRTTRAVVVVTVAAWSSRWQGLGARGRVRHRHGGARLRAREDPAGA